MEQSVKQGQNRSLELHFMGWSSRVKKIAGVLSERMKVSDQNNVRLCGMRTSSKEKRKTNGSD